MPSASAIHSISDRGQRRAILRIYCYDFRDGSAKPSTGRAELLPSDLTRMMLKVHNKAALRAVLQVCGEGLRG